MGVHVSPHPIPLGHPSAPGFEYPVSCIELGLVIYLTYGNLHVSIHVSQIILPSASPRVQKAVFYICASFAVLNIGYSLPSFSKYHIYVLIYFIGVFLTLHSYNRFRFHLPH